MSVGGRTWSLDLGLALGCGGTAVLPAECACSRQVYPSRGPSTEEESE